MSLFNRKQVEKIPTPKKVQQINCQGKDNRGEKTLVHIFEIPEDGSYLIKEIGHDLKVFDANGDVIKMVYFQAGFTWSFDFFYYDDQKEE